jgi:hypothetical protein
VRECGSAHHDEGRTSDKDVSEGRGFGMISIRGDDALRARATIQSGWREVAAEYTLGWERSARAFVRLYPFFSGQLRDIRRAITPGLPLLTYLTREDPPERMVAAIPYADGESRYNCRILGTGEALPMEAAHRLNDFSQALWLLIDTGVLPSLDDGGALEVTLAEWTDRTLLEL